MLWVHFGRTTCCKTRKRLKLLKDPCFIDLKTFAAIVVQRLKNLVLPWIYFFEFNEGFSVVGCYSHRWYNLCRMTKLSLKKKCSRSEGKRFHCALACNFCLLHWCRFVPKGSILTRSPSLTSIHHWVFPLLLIVFTPSVGSMQKEFANCEKLLPANFTGYSGLLEYFYCR